jgi:hypothetical protein
MIDRDATTQKRGSGAFCVFASVPAACWRFKANQTMLAGRCRFSSTGWQRLCQARQTIDSQRILALRSDRLDSAWHLTSYRTCISLGCHFKLQASRKCTWLVLPCVLPRRWGSGLRDNNSNTHKTLMNWKGPRQGVCKLMSPALDSRNPR